MYLGLLFCVFCFLSTQNFFCGDLKNFDISSSETEEIKKQPTLEQIIENLSNLTWALKFRYKEQTKIIEEQSKRMKNIENWMETLNENQVNLNKNLENIAKMFAKIENNTTLFGFTLLKDTMKQHGKDFLKITTQLDSFSKTIEKKTKKFSNSQIMVDSPKITTFKSSRNLKRQESNGDKKEYSEDNQKEHDVIGKFDKKTTIKLKKQKSAGNSEKEHYEDNNKENDELGKVNKKQTKSEQYIRTGSFPDIKTSKKKNF